MAVELALNDSNFSTGMKNLKQQITVIDNTFKASGAGVKDWGNTLDGIQAHAIALGQKISIQKQIVQAYNEQLDKTRAIQDKNAQTMTALKSKLDAAKAAYEQSVTSVGKNDEATKALKETVDELTQKYKSAESAVVKNESSIQGYTIQVSKATAELKEMEAKLAQVNNARLEQLAAQLDTVGSKMESAGEKMMVISAAVVAGAAVASKAAIDFETAFTGVAKTVDATDAQLKEMSKDIRQMALDIPATTTEISAVAEAAGQLGIKTANITGFTKVMIDLGETTDLTANQAATDLAQLANITQMSADKYSNLGSAIVALGNDGASTESQIVSMAKNIAATGELVDLTEPQILALASTLSSLGIEAEAGGTSVSKLLKQFEVLTETGSEDLTAFAEVAGLTAEEFTKAWRKDPLEAVMAFITGLGKLDSAGGSSVATLEELGISEVRMSNAILAMAASGDLLTRSVQTANTAWAENSALQAEAEKRYATTESQLQLAKNTINEVAITMGTEFLPMINNAVEGVKDFGEWVRNLSDDQRENIVRILAITAALGPMVFITGKAVAAVKAVTLAVTAYRAAAAAGATATTALGAAMSATPVGAIATAIALLGSVIIGSLVASAISGKDAVDELGDSLKDLEETYAAAVKSINETADAELGNVSAAKELISTFNDLNSKVNKSAAEQEELAIYAGKINDLLGDQVYVLNETSGAYESAVGSVDDYIAALERQILQQLYADQLAAELQKKIDAKALLESAEAEAKVLADDIKNLEALRDAAPDPEIWQSYEDQVLQARDSQDKLNGTIEQAETDIENAETAIAGYKGQIKETTETVDENTDAVNGSSDAAKDNTEALKKQMDSAKALSKEVDDLNSALAEQEKNGELSTATILDLVDAGYAAVLQINSETGAVTINREAYIALAQAKIDEQIAAAQIDRNALVAQLDAERASTEYLAAAQFGLAASYWATLAAIEKDVAGYDATIAALQAARANVGKYTASVSSGAGSAKTAAEKAAKAFKDAVSEIDYQLEMGIISETEYWEQYAALMGEYLEEGSEAWRDANVRLNKQMRESNEDAYNKLQEIADRAYENGEISLEEYLKESARLRDTYLKDNEEAWTESTETTMDRVREIHGEKLQGIVDDYNDARDKIVDSQADLASKLTGISNLTETTKDASGNSVTTLSNLGDTLATIKAYSTKMAELKEKGISPSMLAYILKMNPEDAIAAADLLLALSDSQWSTEMSQWEEIQTLSAETAALLYSDQLTALDEALLENVTGFTDELAAAGLDLGTNTIDGIVKGIKDGTIDVVSAMSSVINAAIAAAERAAGIASPSKKGTAIGLNIGQSIGTGAVTSIDKSTPEVQESVSSMLSAAAVQAKALRFDATSAISSLTNQVAGSNSQPAETAASGSYVDYSAMADIIAARVSTAISGMSPGVEGGDLTLVLRGNDTDIARWLLPAFRQVSASTPEVEADF
jgi:TP901 family phage tail tape measure protein